MSTEPDWDEIVRHLHHAKHGYYCAECTLVHEDRCRDCQRLYTALRDAYRLGAAHERVACAKLCDDSSDDNAWWYADRIRARGKGEA